MRGRLPSERSKWYLPVNQYLLALEYALNYRDWEAEIRALENQSKAIRYDKDKVQTSNDYNATEEAAMEILELRKKLERIDKAIELVSDGLDKYIRLAVCYGFTYTQLTTGRYRMPLNKNEFGEIKHHFYYVLYYLI